MIGERVICIKEQIFDHRMKVGKQFTIKDYRIKDIHKSYHDRYTGQIGSGNEYYVVVSDIGEEIGWLDSTHFKHLSEIREEKLQELGI